MEHSYSYDWMDILKYNVSIKKKKFYIKKDFPDKMWLVYLHQLQDNRKHLLASNCISWELKSLEQDRMLTTILYNKN